MLAFYPPKFCYNVSMTHYIPFGKNCAISLIVREAGLRQESLPFDWVIGYPQHLKRSLDLKFEDWFIDEVTLIKDSEESVNLVNEKESSGHGTVHPNYPVDFSISDTNAFLTHFDMTSLEVRNSVRKRINRFYNIIASDDPVVFVSSVPLDDLIYHGLVDYFDKKVDFILVQWNQSSERYASMTKHMGYDVLNYSGITQFDAEAIAIAGAVLHSHIK